MILPFSASVESSILEVIVFTGFLYWLCPSFVRSLFERIARMVDIVTSRMFESFNRFSPNPSNQTNSLTTLSNMKRFSRNQRFKTAISREADIKHRESQLFNIKDNIPNVELPRPKSISRLACQNCTQISRESLVNKTTEKMALKNMFIRHSPNYGFMARYLSDVYYNWMVPKLDYYLESNEILLMDERITNSIERMTDEQYASSKKQGDKEFYAKLLQSNKSRAQKLLSDMSSALNDYVLRCSNWFFHKMFPLFLNSVLVHPGQIAMIQEASKSGLPLIFLPLHRSHLDYLLLTYITFNNGIKCPLVAAGDNLRLPFFGQVLKGLGAFFIKRRIDPVEGSKDHIYKGVLHAYINHALRNGHNIEFYMEGGRTRSGKPLMPKCGIFSIIVDALNDGTIEDALLVPVSMNYDKLVDGNFIREQLGESKKMENVLDTIKSLWKSINGDYGMVKVDFNQPCSLRELVKTFKQPNDANHIQKKKLCSTVSNSSIYGTDVVSTINKNIIENISRHVLYDACQSVSVMATNAVAFLLLTKFRNGAPIQEIAIALDSLRQDLDHSQKELSFQGNSIDVINYAMEMLGPTLIRIEKVEKKEIIKPKLDLASCIHLCYYSNTLVPLYAMHSIIALAINCLDDESGYIDADCLMKASNELCDILQFEFIFCKPCQSIEQSLQCYLDDLKCRKQIFVSEDETYLQSRSRRMAMQFEDEDEEEAYTSIKYQLNYDSSAVENLKFYRVILLPLIECYAVSAQTMSKLEGKTLLESELIQEVLDNLRMQLMNKSILYCEAISTDSVRNALKLFISWGILDCHNEGKLRLYYLKNDSDNEQAIRDLFNKINKYRP